MRIEAERVKEIRAKLGLTQLELASLLYVHRRTAKRWEKRGVRGPAAHQLLRMEAEHEMKERLYGSDQAAGG